MQPLCMPSASWKKRTFLLAVRRWRTAPDEIQDPRFHEDVEVAQDARGAWIRRLAVDESLSSNLVGSPDRQNRRGRQEDSEGQPNETHAGCQCKEGVIRMLEV